MRSITCSTPRRSYARAGSIASCWWSPPATGSADGSGRWSWTGWPARSTTSARGFSGKPANRCAPEPPSPAAEEIGEPIEHRYPLDDFQRFFAGFGLDVRGTAAGFDKYPPDPYGQPPLREAFGRATYDALVAIEDALYARDLDLHAKHWVIYAERGAPDRLRTPAPLARTGEPPRLQGAHDVEYLAIDVPAEADAGRTLLCALTLRNRSWRTLIGADLSGPRETNGAAPIFASYHWLDGKGAIAVQDGARTPLPHPIVPGASCEMTLRVDTPQAPGRYTLAVDLVEEGVCWFSGAGAPLLRRAITSAEIPTKGRKTLYLPLLPPKGRNLQSLGLQSALIAPSRR